MGKEPAPAPEVGEAVPVYDDSDYWAPARSAPKAKQLRSKASRGKRRSRQKRPAGKENYRRRMVNWAMVGLVMLILLFVSVVGGYIYLKVTPGGQLILARLGREASADAYWALGTELLDQGYISRSISTYEQALDLQPEHPELVKKLMLLGEAYEAGGQQDKAEEVYERIYSKLAPSETIGYVNAIRLMLQREDGLDKAVDLMLKAAEKTGDESFLAQRASMVPLPPTAMTTGGSQLITTTVGFVSPQGYPIYYAAGNETLPEDGKLFTEPFDIGEGIHVFRAVCVSSKLVSDEMSVRYIVSLPSPPAPKANLAAKEYQGSRSVKLRDMETDTKDPKKKNRLYFSLDGRPATQDSPEYTGEAIKLPGGRVTLHAIAVNGYGKVSNQLTQLYTIRNVPYNKYFNGSDEFQKLRLMKTSYEDFVGIYGEPQGSEPIEDDAVGAVCTLARYPWGEARFARIDTGNMLYQIKTSDSGMTGPRGIQVGAQLTDVYAKFRDMGQPPNARGDRGLYYDLKEGYANFVATENDPTSGRLLYVATLFDKTSSTRLLSFEVEAGRVKSIDLRYVDRKLSNVL